MRGTRLLILGASGQLGYPLLLEARQRWGRDVHGTYHTLPAALREVPGLHRLDLLDRAPLADLLGRLRPAVVLNCAGIVKAVCRDPYPAIIVNAALPHLVAELLRPWEGRLIQISTDCVFSGRRGAYSESDTPDPDDLYGRTKVLGEVTHEPHLTIRTSFIGFELHTARGLLAWFLSRRGAVRGFRGAIWSGLTADHLAKLLADFADRDDVKGLLHVAGEAVDKYSLLRLLAEAFDRDNLTIEASDMPRIDRSLDSSRLRQLGIEVPSVADMVRGLRRWGIERGLYAARTAEEV